MDRAIATNERKYAAHDTDAERQTLGVPCTHVEECGKDFLSITFGTQNQERNENSEEAEDVQHQQSAFELRQEPSSCYIDEDAEQNDHPVEQGDMPVLGDIGVWLAEDQEALDQSTSEEAT